MEIPQFVQCLEYISSHAAIRDPMDRAMPLINILSGVTIGFVLNKASDFVKGKRDENKKIEIIREEVERVKNLYSKTYKEAVHLLDESLAGHNVRVFLLPSRVKLGCISEFFIPLSHRFSEPERHAIFNLISSNELLNDFLREFTTAAEQPNDPIELGNMSLNLANTTSSCYYLCEDFQKNARRTNLIHTTDLADTLGINNSPFILRRKQQNKVQETAN
jgi:hypothetical protein